MPDKSRIEGFKTIYFRGLEPELSRLQAGINPVSFFEQFPKTPQIIKKVALAILSGFNI